MSPTALLLLAAYFLGGFTVIPFGLFAAYIFLSKPADSDGSQDVDAFGRERRDGETDQDISLEAAGVESQSGVQESDVAAAYFAVCRDFRPMSVSRSSLDRSGPSSSPSPGESPSVYRSMYRNIFDRQKATSSAEGDRQKQKRTRNVYFIVLRLRHLMFYDDIEQVEVRHVLSLEHFEVDIYGGGDTILEGELFVKRNCIRLRRTASREHGNLATDSRPFFLFSDNCSEKEDFYHALIQSQRRTLRSLASDAGPLHFESAHMAKLVQLLHKSGDNVQTRWINALVGRLFLSLYKTEDAQQFVRSKIVKKLSRVQTPAFIRDITVGRITLGDSAPLITNPKLKELTIDGDLTIETDVRYRGNFRLEIAALARLDLGQRFKAREVNLKLAGICKSLDGHLFIRIKPPPSNRLWISFETMPKMDLSVEPVVSSRQITYGVVLRAIESRIRDTIADTLVLPNWDDVPFKDTLGQDPRGGLWQASEGSAAKEEAETRVGIQTEASSMADSESEIAGAEEHSLSIDSSNDLLADTSSAAESFLKSPSEPILETDEVLTAERSPSISVDNVSEAGKSASHERAATTSQQDVAETTGLSPEYGRWRFRRKPVQSSHSRNSSATTKPESVASTVGEAGHGASDTSSGDSNSIRRRAANSSAAEAHDSLHDASKTPSIPSSTTDRPVSQPTKASDTHPPFHSDNAISASSSAPIGRGRPLPPPGTPLPGPNRPAKFGWGSPLGLMKRRNGNSSGGPPRTAHPAASPGASSSLPNLSAPSSAQHATPAGSGAEDARPSTSSSNTTSTTTTGVSAAASPVEKPPLPPRRTGAAATAAAAAESTGARGKLEPRRTPLARGAAERREDSSGGVPSSGGGDGGVDGDGLLVIQAPESGRESPVSDVVEEPEALGLEEEEEGKGEKEEDKEDREEEVANPVVTSQAEA